MTTEYKPPAAALIERIRAHTDKLAAATDQHEALAALFLLHCECRKVAEALPVETGQEQPTEGETP